MKRCARNVSIGILLIACQAIPTGTFAQGGTGVSVQGSSWGGFGTLKLGVWYGGTKKVDVTVTCQTCHQAESSTGLQVLIDNYNKNAVTKSVHEQKFYPRLISWALTVPR